MIDRQAATIAATAVTARNGVAPTRPAIASTAAASTSRSARQPGLTTAVHDAQTNSARVEHATAASRYVVPKISHGPRIVRAAVPAAGPRRRPSPTDSRYAGIAVSA